ncbi:MAG: BON domain-containing protein [Proteobacteria bacterium]|nr:BON domain-containing protein [Pseudomonadota bacterium]
MDLTQRKENAMARQDWYDREDEARRMARRRDREDFGQADYSRDYSYDPDSRSGYRASHDRRPAVYDFGQADYSDDYAYDETERRAYRHRRADGAPYDDDTRFPRRDEQRSWTERAGDFLSGHRRDEDYGPRARRMSDRALRDVIVDRLEAQRNLDLRDVEVLVEDREVTLNGRVRNKADKRRIEDIADIDGVRHVQNNLRAHDHTHWTFL